MKERLIQLMQLLGVSPTQFANQIGVQRATLQHILSGRNEASLKIVTGINQAYPSVNLQWLLYGKGQAIEQSAPASANAETDSLMHDENLIFPINDMVAPEYRNPEPADSTPDRDNLQNNRTQPCQTQSSEDKKIKEIMVLFEDGTYKKFIPAPTF